MESRMAAQETRKTACSRDCPDACSIVVTVEDGKAVHLAGDRDDPITQGFLCERTNRFLFRQYAADRLTSPLLRKGGRLTPVSWDEALDYCAEKLLAIKAESGPEAIMHYRSGGSLGILKAVPDYLFDLFGPVTTKRGDICNGSGEWAQEADFGISESNDIFDLLNSKLIILWGKNVHTSGPHLLPILRKAKANGTKIVAIDIWETKAATIADRFIKPAPGADYALAMGIARHLFENGGIDRDAPEYCENFDAFKALAFDMSMDDWARQAGVPIQEIRDLGAMMIEHAPVGIQVGWGLARRRNGAATVRAIDALGAISGNVGIPGGCVSYYYGRRTAFDTTFAPNRKKSPRTLAEPKLGAEILAANEPPIRAVWITAGNPVTMLPDSRVVADALRSRDLVVVVDTHPTDTTDIAHVVLPTLTLLEDSDLLGAYGNHQLRTSVPAIDPPAGARHEIEILQGLAKRLGLGSALAGSVDDWKKRCLTKLEPAGVTLERLEAGAVKNPFAAEVVFAGRKFKTPNGKCRLMTEHALPPIRLRPDFPFTLAAISTPKGQSSQWSCELTGPAEVFIHPDSARGFRDGEIAYVESRRASMEVIVRTDPKVRREVMVTAKGGMIRQGRCSNLLVSATLTDFGEGCAYYDEPVRLRKKDALRT